MSAQFAYAPHVRSVTHGNRTVLLDLRRGKYYSLDEVGTRVWTLLGHGTNVPDIVAHLGEEFDAPVEQITADVDRLLRQLAEDWRVIVPVVQPLPPMEPSRTVCALTLVMVTLGLRIIGLRRSLATVEWLARRVRPAAEPSPDFLANVVRKVATAAAFFPGRALCLEQALTLSLCLRRRGVAARLRIGAQPYPFAAHAWVEHHGKLVGASHDQVSQFVPFERLVEAG
jgi:transglutaminase superfamily protein/coenzyme PQQ synthesis protein D (PqqD)